MGFKQQRNQHSNSRSHLSYKQPNKALQYRAFILFKICMHIFFKGFKIRFNCYSLFYGREFLLALFITCSVASAHAETFGISVFQKDFDQETASFTKNLEKSLESQSNLQQNIEIYEVIATPEQALAAKEMLMQSEQIVCRNFSSDETTQQTDFYIFISSSLPEHLLKQMVLEAKKYNGILVMRGLINNSVRETVKYLQQFVMDEGDGIIIDPTLFQKYQIKLVPSFVLSRADTLQYDVLKGVVTPHYALLQFSKRGDLKAEALFRLKP